MPSRILTKGEKEKDPAGFVIYNLKLDGQVDMNVIIKELSEVEQKHKLTRDGGLIAALAYDKKPEGTIETVKHPITGIKIQANKAEAVLSDIKDKGYEIIG